MDWIQIIASVDNYLKNLDSDYNKGLQGCSCMSTRLISRKSWNIIDLKIPMAFSFLETKKL
jgi:hypothetical protein